MNHSHTKIHIQIGFHRILPSMHFCLHGLSPVLDTLHCLVRNWAQRPPGPWAGLVDPQAGLGQVREGLG